jgi:hypothetical protein
MKLFSVENAKKNCGLRSGERWGGAAGHVPQNKAFDRFQFCI